MAKKNNRTKNTFFDASKNFAEKARQVTDTAKEITGLSKAEQEKASIRQDVDDAVNWVKMRNQNIMNGEIEIEKSSIPTLAKVIFGGENRFQLLSEEDKIKYSNYFKRNGSRIALLTAINPAIGIGVASAELASSGLIPNEVSAGAAVAGAGIIGASALASTLTPVSYVAWSALQFIPQVRLIGIGLFAFGAGTALFKSVSKLPQGQRIAEVFEETQSFYNDCYKKIEANTLAMEQILRSKIQDAVEVLGDVSKKVAITIDDAVHSDQNMRIMQYQEIVLKQYNSQKKIRETLTELINSYNKLKIENDQLTMQIHALEANLQTLVCGSEYLK